MMRRIRCAGVTRCALRVLLREIRVDAVIRYARARNHRLLESGAPRARSILRYATLSASLRAAVDTF